MDNNMVLSTQRIFGKIVADNMVIFWKQCLIMQRLINVQIKPIEMDQIKYININYGNLERRVNKLEYEVYGIYL